MRKSFFFGTLAVSYSISSSVNAQFTYDTTKFLDITGKAVGTASVVHRVDGCEDASPDLVFSVHQALVASTNTSSDSRTSGYRDCHTGSDPENECPDVNADGRATIKSSDPFTTQYDFSAGSSVIYLKADSRGRYYALGCQSATGGSISHSVVANGDYPTSTDTLKFTIPFRVSTNGKINVRINKLNLSRTIHTLSDSGTAIHNVQGYWRVTGGGIFKESSHQLTSPGTTNPLVHAFNVAANTDYEFYAEYDSSNSAVVGCALSICAGEVDFSCTDYFEVKLEFAMP